MPKPKPQNVAVDPENTYRHGQPVPPVTRVPTPPSDFDPAAPANLRGVKPRTSELNLISDAVKNLRAFDDYAQVFGRTAPPHDVLLETLARAEGWSMWRVAMARWDVFCSVQEGYAWKDARLHLSTLGPAFELADKADPSLTVEHVALAGLVRAMKTIVRKGIATKRANKQAVAEGREPLRGKALRAARKAAERAILAEATTKKAGKK